ncbi:LysR family transcriptional regulator [Curvivirga sp.]|uniref:LysR family transcriptional regulator n=1 Tax=Curvivirga sp. TaxID=2856848 RepID=UPI003B5AEAFB
MKEDKKLLPILKALYVFEIVVQVGSLTKAANRLGIPQPSVSRYISNLEAILEVSLLDRHRAGVSVTREGEILFKAVELGFGHVNAALKQISTQSKDRKFYISCTHGFAQMWVLPRLEALKKMLPEWDIRLNTSDQQRYEDEDESDLVIRFGSGHWENIDAYHLFGEEAFPVCAPAYMQKNGLDVQNITPHDIGQLDLIAQDFGDLGWISWSEWLSHFGLQSANAPIQHPVPSYNFILQEVARGNGVALAWSHLIEPYLSNGWLLELPNMRLQSGNGYYATMKKGHPLKKVVESWLAAACR